MQSPQELAHVESKRLYWQRNALPTCAVLLAVVVLSVLVRPLSLQLVFGCALGGVLVFVGNALANGNRALLGLLAVVSGVFVFVWSMAQFGVVRGPLMWAQGVALFGAALFGCVAAANAVRASKDSRREGSYLDPATSTTVNNAGVEQAGRDDA